MQDMLMRLMSKGEYLIDPKGTKFTGSGKLGLKVLQLAIATTVLCYIRPTQLVRRILMCFLL